MVCDQWLAALTNRQPLQARPTDLKLKRIEISDVHSHFPISRPYSSGADRGGGAHHLVCARDLQSSRDVLTRPAPPADHRIAYGQNEFQFGDLRLPKGEGVAPSPSLFMAGVGCPSTAFRIWAI